MPTITLTQGKNYIIGSLTFDVNEPTMRTQNVSDEVAKILLDTGKFEIGYGDKKEEVKPSIVADKSKKKCHNAIFLLHHVSSSEGYGSLGSELMTKYPCTVGDVRDGIDLNDSIKVSLDNVSEHSNIIQMCAGDLFMNYKSFNKSIGYTMFETTDLPISPRIWKDIINQNIDLLLVPAEEVKNVFVRSGVNVPVKVVPLWVNEEYTYIKRPQRDTFKFLWAGKLDAHNRKGWLDAIDAFKEEFKDEKDVRLIIKTTTPPLSEEKMNEILADKRVSFVKGILSRKEFMDLFEEADCFVFPTHGEGFGLPPLEAMATGLPTIISDWMGCSEFASRDVCYPIKITKLEKASYPLVYGNVGKWATVDINDVRKLMRHVYENRDEAKEIGIKAAKLVNKKYRFDNFKENLSAAIGDNLTVKDSVSIVIAIKDNLNYLKQCIKSIYKWTKVDFELIVVDNDSGNEVKAFLNKLVEAKSNAKVITNSENIGHAYAMNQGIKVAANEYICMLDADTIVSKDWLEDMMQCFYLYDDCGIVTPSQSVLSDMVYVNFDEELTPENVGLFSDKLKKTHKEVEYDKTYGFCHLVKKSVYTELGSYDWKRYLNAACRETDLFWRASIRGYKIYWAKGAFVYHYMGKIKESLGQKPYDMVQRGKKILNERQSYPEDYYVRNDVKAEGV